MSVMTCKPVCALLKLLLSIDWLLDLEFLRVALLLTNQRVEAIILCEIDWNNWITCMRHLIYFALDLNPTEKQNDT